MADRVAAILMAAGESRRWGADNKLLVPLAGQPMIRRTAEAILGSAVRPVIVVTGHDAGAVMTALVDFPVRFVHAADFAEGMSASLKMGLAAVPPDCDAALVCLGDMPFVRADTLDRLAAATDGTGKIAAVFPTFDGQRGNPVLLHRGLFGDIAMLPGDVGAKAVLRRIPDRVAEFAVDDPGILQDFDSPDMLPR